MPPHLLIVDCLSGALERIGQFPHQLNETDAMGHSLQLVFDAEQEHIHIHSINAPANAIQINGVAIEHPVTLQEGLVYSLQIGRRLTVFQINPPADWPPVFDPTTWQVFNTTSGKLLTEATPADIPAQVAKHNWDPTLCALCPKGLDTGFHLASIAPVFSTSPAAIKTTDRGKYLCPACWLHFDAGDALSVAAHDSLRNDPVLGADHMLRFNPTRFNDAGLALDPMGLPCTDIACPHCRRRLPPGFFDLPHKIFSLIGAPSAGKSYLLAVLVKELHHKLYQDFGLIFKDGDPTGNMLLNQMSNRLFSGSTPEECVLGKTAMEGATYERLPRYGKWVALPRPFVYTLSSDRPDHPSNASIIFYDNAGEHFEPGHSMDDSPGALHVASSSGLIFLYDPTSNPAFRRALSGSTDPQLHQQGRADQQDSILAEMEIRIKKMLGLTPVEKIPVPIAILLGKCDVWQNLLDARSLPRPVRDNRLDLACLNENSRRIRTLLADLCPGLVAHSESLSSQVRYFAVSSLGHSPAPLEDGPHAGLLAPDPHKLNPIGVELPVYWLLSQILPDLIPSAPQT